ncbi:hypothetical protein [Synechococcus sp. CBW1004]|jgi:hypothetical protein|uniref:hypothetical protein n=1 Tax=Synechococcus sp. CBW1004 TaxID=1353136 RepID=UPI0018CDA41D|nr:hypothetical protein [Synechococcus sp. CBW1004]QPN64643.1 hypothetical protein H8F25_08035 [Synechococcus sp. CBW1004]
MTSDESRPSAGTPADPADAGAHHNFDIQKEEHRRIRNDPDYDDWEYGTEPLPHEAWLTAQRASGRKAAASGENASA